MKGVKGDELRAFMSQLSDELSQPVSQSDILSTLKRVKPSVGEHDLAKFAKWMEEFGAV